MPAVSKAQARFMRGVASGSIKAPGLSRQKAREYVAGRSTKGLPERKGKRMASSKGAGFAGRKPPSSGRKTNAAKSASKGVKAKAPVGNSARGLTRGKPPTKMGKTVTGANAKGKRAKGYSK